MYEPLVPRRDSRASARPPACTGCPRAARICTPLGGSRDARDIERCGHSWAPETGVLQMVRWPPPAPSTPAPVEAFSVKRKAPYLSDEALVSGLHELLTRGWTNTAEQLDHIAEVDSRKLYRPRAYPSMFAYCVEELHLSEDSAYKRIQAARAAVRFPVIFDSVAGGRLHLSAVCMLAPHLTKENASELLTAATHRSKSQIERLLAERFPRPDLPAIVRAIPGPFGQLAPGQVGDAFQLAAAPTGEASQEASTPGELAPGQVQASVATGERSRVKPIAPQRFAVQFTWSEGANDKLRHAQELLGHRVASGDLAQIFEMALDALIPGLEKRKFAATTQPRRRRSQARLSESTRRIPAHVKRAVWKRDGGQCTFVSENGRRCQEKKGLQFDHALEIARGGEAGVGDIRLRCHAHNQLTAEHTFGAEFMRHKRTAAAEARAAGRAEEGLSEPRASIPPP